MKKTYEKPALEILPVQSEEIIAVSGGGSVSNAEEEDYGLI